MQSLDRLVIMLVASFFLCFTPLEIYHLLNIFNMGIRSGEKKTQNFVISFRKKCIQKLSVGTLKT